MVQDERIKRLNNKPVRPGRYVLYWMQAAQRIDYNHALEFAIGLANEKKLPVVVCFGLTDDYPGANFRHYYFMLEGLSVLPEAMAKRGVQMVVRKGRPERVAVDMAKDAAALIVDDGYLSHQRKWRSQVAKQAGCGVFEVCTNLIVPVETASAKQEFAARTFRPRIHRQLDKFLCELKKQKTKKDSLGLKFDGLDIIDTDNILAGLNIDDSVGPSPIFHGGTSKAKKLLKDFTDNKLDDFADKRNDPNAGCLSNMSPYLHFGQISPLYIALAVSRCQSAGKEAYLEELIVRRELSHNFVYYNDNYDSPAGLEKWSLKTLAEHKNDNRQYVYSRNELEKAATHDEYWNAAQKEMIFTGKMHGYMRMYWGKKILEWSEDIETAYANAIYLNDKYELDGRDPNGYTGIAWCFGKHDRAWAERPVFGKVRYMNAAGLKRKFDIDAYVQRIEKLKKQ